ncbi:hypothetical protein ACS5PK_12210 [Roseateles sp. DB2]|uniref:hypothetical protein n=1 Tax=Roseateles sp. DB2 TaxID=3453717 RepID=UPI003EED5605
MNTLPALPDADRPWSAALLDLVAHKPASGESPRPLAEREARARALTEAAARKAAATAAGLALPPGPLGWLTVLPELLAVWRIQAQLVADVAALHGHSAELGRDQMLYCLFRHTAAQAVRDLAVRAGERAGQAVLQRVLQAIGVKLGERSLGSAVARWVPLAGAAGVGAYAWWDTRQVGRSAQALFASLPD